MIYLTITYTVIFIGLIWLYNQAQKRYDAAIERLQRQNLALVDKAALSLTEKPDSVATGKVSYIDEKREVELDDART